MKNNMTKGSQETMNTPDWEVYLWECNPQLIDWFLNDIVANNTNVQLITKAASTENGHATFFMTAGQEDKPREDLPNPTCDPKSPYQIGGASTLYGNAKRAGKEHYCRDCRLFGMTQGSKIAARG